MNIETGIARIGVVLGVSLGTAAAVALIVLVWVGVIPTDSYSQKAFYAVLLGLAGFAGGFLPCYGLSKGINWIIRGFDVDKRH